MGFIPIFLTLGAFIFLFALVVHQNLKQKKNLLTTELINISSLFKGVVEKDKTKPNIPDVLTIKMAEHLLKSVSGKEENVKFQQQIKAIRQKLNEVKRIHHDYNKLIATKPYYFVALLMGHQPI
jgi:ABC-type uncharacterized transport system substrate-binding protein